MAHDTLGPAFWRIGRAAGPADARSDADLVAAFVRSRCDIAFAELVARHGPVVLGTCRRTLGNTPDADDAFQATFLVLARKAATVRPPGAIGAWLYGVAWKVATKARGLAAKRAARDRLAAKPEAVSDPMTDPTLRPLLDAELARLPDALRTVVVLCDLGGKSRAEAAKELGWPEGTVATRLAKGRAALAERLRRRGVTLTVAGLTAAISSVHTSAAVPSDLFESTLTATTAATGLTPAAVALAAGATRAMTLAKLVPAMIVVLAGGLVLAGAAAFPSPTNSGEPQKPRVLKTEPSPAAPPAKAEEPGGWKEAAEIKLTGWLPGSVAYSPDGKTLVVGGTSGFVRSFDSTTRKEVWTYQIKATATRTAVAYSPDGKTVAATFKHGVELIDATNGQEIDSINEPESNPSAVGYFSDKPIAGTAETSRGLVYGDARGYWVKKWLKLENVGTIRTVTGPDGKAPADLHAVPFAVAPNGEHAVITGPIDPATGKNVLWAYACGGGGGNHLLEGHKATVVSAAWSADGKTIVTGDADGVVILWDTKTWKEKQKHGFDRRVCAVAVTGDGERIAVAVVANNQVEGGGAENYYERVYFLETTTQVLNALAQVQFKLATLMEMVDDDHPLVQEALVQQDFLQKLSLKHHQTLPVKNDKAIGGPFQGVAGLAFSPDGTELAAGFCNFTHLSRSGRLVGTVRVWKLAEKEPPPAPAAVWKETVLTGDHSKTASSVAFSPDGSTFVTGGFEDRIAVWDAKTLKLRSSFPIKDGERKGLAVAYGPDGKLIAVATHESSVALYDPEKGNNTRLSGQSSWAGGAMVVVFSPDGTKLAATDGKKTRVIDITKRGSELVMDPAEQQGTAIATFLPGLAWSADGRYLASTRRQTNDDRRGYIVWDTATGQVVQRPTDTSIFITSVAWSPDGKTFANSNVDGRTYLWDAKTWEQKHSIPEPRVSKCIRLVRFGPKPNMLTVVNNLYTGTSIRFFDLSEKNGPSLVDDLFVQGQIIFDLAHGTNGKQFVALSFDVNDERDGPIPKKTELRVWRKQ